MAGLQDLVQRFQRSAPRDVVGIDLGRSGIKIVRMKNSKDGASIVDVDVLPPIDLTDPEAEGLSLDIPKHLTSKHAAVCISSPNAVIKLLSFPGRYTESMDEQLNTHMGLGDGRFRIGYHVIPTGRKDSKLLAVALPDDEISTLLGMMSSGLPAPYSVEVSSVASLTAFINGPGVELGEGACGLIEFGTQSTLMALFNKGEMVLLRKFAFGSDSIMRNVEASLGVDRETALGIIADSSFDISQPVNEATAPFIKQLVISRDFVERRENCKIEQLYFSGGITTSSDWLVNIRRQMGFEIQFFNPFASIAGGDEGLLENLQGQESRFSAAIGAVEGVFA